MPPADISFNPAAIDFLDSLPPGKLRVQIATKIKQLASDPFPSGCKKLVETTHKGQAVWRIRIRDYRVLYVCKQNQVMIVDIDHRKQVYR